MKTLCLKALSFSVLSLALLPGCLPSDSSSTGSNNSSSESSTSIRSEQGDSLVYGKMAVDVNLHPLHKTVCDPFNEDNRTDTLKSGLTARLFYRTLGMSRFYKTQDYIDKAQLSEQKLFFTDLNVPTRLFSAGFSTPTRDVIKDDQGQKLVEYFGVQFETEIRLTEDDAPGNYEFALLSDDGSKMILKSAQGQKETLIDNDGDHQTRMGCSKRVVYMDEKSRLNTEFQYYQGPRFHISNVLLWRKSESAGQDSRCGDSGNHLFFDPDKQSQPQQAYKDLLARGWQVVPKQNFFIPQKETYNPCTSGTAPIISQLRVDEVFMDSALISWTTDIPATAQIKITNLSTQKVTMTSTDNLLRTQHQILLQGLDPQTTYSIQAVAISEDLGHSIGQTLEFTTP